MKRVQVSEPNHRLAEEPEPDPDPDPGPGLCGLKLCGSDWTERGWENKASHRTSTETVNGSWGYRRDRALWAASDSETRSACRRLQTRSIRTWIRAGLFTVVRCLNFHNYVAGWHANLTARPHNLSHNHPPSNIPKKCVGSISSLAHNVCCL